MDGTQVAKLPLPRCLVGDDICYLHINTLSGWLRADEIDLRGLQLSDGHLIA